MEVAGIQTLHFYGLTVYPLPRHWSRSGDALMNPLDLVNLMPLMDLTSGRPEVVVGLIDSPVVADHPDLPSENLRAMPGKVSSFCAQSNSAACMHGTFNAGEFYRHPPSLGHSSYSL